jgi:hypothetical protein
MRRWAPAAIAMDAMSEASTTRQVLRRSALEKSITVFIIG